MTTQGRGGVGSAPGRKPVHGRRSRYRVVIEVLDAVSRSRALTDAESEHLEWAIKIEQDMLARTGRKAFQIPGGRDAPRSEGVGG